MDLRALLTLAAWVLLGPLPAAAAQQAATALSEPLFVRIDEASWGVFPPAAGHTTVIGRRLVVRDEDGSRHLELELPAGWGARADEPSGAVVHSIGPSGTRELEVARSLAFVDASGATALRLRFGARDRLELQWSPDVLRDAPAIGLGFQGDGDESALVGRPSTRSADPRLRWVAHGGRRYGLEVQGEGGLSGNPLKQELVFGTFLGGSRSESVRAMAPRPGGGLVATGISSSLEFPTVDGAYDPTGDLANDVFLVGLDAHGSTLQFATFFGGTDYETPAALHVDSDGTLLIAGRVGSTDLPTTPGAFDTTWNGTTEDGFVARFAPDGSALLACTYLGGSAGGTDELLDMAIDPNDGTLVVSGNTCSNDWPTTPGSLFPNQQGVCDLVVTRLSPGLDQLVASTYLGGPSGDVGADALGVLSDGSVVLDGGSTAPPSFPITLDGAGVFPGADASDQFYMVRLTPALDALVWSTWSQAGFNGIHERADGSLVLVGSTRSPEFPTTEGAFSNEFSGLPGFELELVACAVTPDAETLLWSTYITANGGVFPPADSVLDEEGRLFFCGSIATEGYPFTPDALDTDLVGLSETQLTVLDPTGSNVLYASLIGVGGSSQSQIGSLALDGCGGVFVAGQTSSPSFPTTPGAFDETHNGFSDAWIVRLTALSPWANLGGALPGIKGRPDLTATGPLCDGDPTTLTVSKGPDHGSAFLVLGLSELAAPFKGGTLIPAPDLSKLLGLDADGARTLAFAWPADSPSGLQLWLQAWLPDPAAALGFSATNAVRATTP